MKGIMNALRFSGAGLFFVGAGLLALLTGFSIYAYLGSAVPSSQVFIVTRDLPPGSEITDLDLQASLLPAGAVPAGAIKSKQQATGLRVRFGLMSGDIVREAHLVPKGSSELGQALQEKGPQYRAVMLPAELVPAIDRLLPGDKLELTGVLPFNDLQTSTKVAVPLGTAIVLEVRKAQGQTDQTAVLVALQASEVSRLALTMRTGNLMVAVRGDDTEPAPAMRLEEVTGEPLRQTAQPQTVPPNQAAQTGR